MRATIGAVSALLGFISLASSPADAQPASTESSRAQPTVRRFCFRGRPAPVCDWFFLVEGGFYKPMYNTIRPVPAATERYDVRGLIPGAFGNHGTWEIGAMANVDKRSAFGATALWGAGGVGSFRTGVRARYRLWLKDTLSLEVASGPIWMTIKDAGGAAGMVISSDLRVNYQDRLALTYRLDRVQRRGFAAGHAAYLGASLGSKNTIVGTLVGSVLLIVGIAIAVSNMN
jgi:hypothetical protein